MTRHRTTSAVVRGLISVALFLAVRTVSADNITVAPVTYGTGVDGGADYGWTIDGSFDSVLPGSVLYVTKSQGVDLAHQIERRAMYEFALPAALNQPGVTINQATLYLPSGSPSMMGSDNLYIYGYSGDGQLSLSDFANTGNPVWVFPGYTASTPFNYATATGFIQSLVGTASHAGFVAAFDGWETSLDIGANATLTIDYSVPVNQPPTVNITAPAPNSQFAFGAPITFQATASDPENTPVGTIAWRSSQSGNTIIGWGSPMTTSALAVGTHVISASTTDSSGLAGQASITITIGSPTASYCDARGSNSSYEWIKSVTVGSYTNTSNNNGGYGNFTSAAPIGMVTGSNGITLAPGFSGGSYSEYWGVWIDLNQDGRFDGNEKLLNIGSGSSISSTLTIPTSATMGKTRMRVAMSYGSTAQPCGTFSYGEVEDYTVDISSTPPPTPGAYCASKSNSASYEWINQIALAGVTRTTGQNGGYGNFTSQAPIAVARGANALGLAPGFGSALYTEHWRAWIDFNQDGVFADNEVVYSGVSQAPISTSITVPTTAKAGTTRMRISMKYGSLPTPCETFSYGEVEDHNVNISP